MLVEVESVTVVYAGSPCTVSVLETLGVVDGDVEHASGQMYAEKVSFHARLEPVPDTRLQGQDSEPIGVGCRERAVEYRDVQRPVVCEPYFHSQIRYHKGPVGNVGLYGHARHL